MIYLDKASAELDAAKKTLTVTGILLPHDELQHHILAALLSESDPPVVSVDYKNVENVVSFVLSFESKRDIVAIGKENLEIAKAATDAGLTVVDYKAKLAQLQAQRDAEEKKDAEEVETKPKKAAK